VEELSERLDEIKKVFQMVLGDILLVDTHDLNLELKQELKNEISKTSRVIEEILQRKSVKNLDEGSKKDIQKEVEEVNQLIDEIFQLVTQARMSVSKIIEHSK
jgi:hypothetical protein